MQKKINKIIFIIAFILFITFIIFFIYNKNNLKEYSKTFNYLDTQINIKIYDKKNRTKELKEIEKIYQKYDVLTDRYQEYEGINNLYYIYYNNLDVETLTLDSELYDMIKFGKEYYEKSNLIDISKGNIYDIWKMYLDSKSGYPLINELKKADINNIEDIVLLSDNKIKNNHPNIFLDYYKVGYVTNIVKEYLKKEEIDKYLINAGDTILLGNYYKEDGEYSVGLENPNIKDDIYKVIKGNNISINTKGNYQKYYEYEGKRYNYLINPTTLMPGDKMKSVSVICSDCKEGSLLATMLFFMDIEKGQELINNMENVEAIWYTNDNKEIKSDGFFKYEIK